MGRLNKIERTINDTISHYSHVKVVPRGLPRFVDPLLRGIIRFAKRSGNTVSLINPDNTYKFATPPQIRDDKFELKEATKWIDENSILSMGPDRELHQVYDVIDTTVLLKKNLTQIYTSDDRVLLHSVPMYLLVTANKDDTTLTIKTKYRIANGDTFVYLQDETLLQSLSEIRISQAVFLGTVGTGTFNLLYSITLESPLPRSLELNTTVYLRAYPAYFSAQVRVPNALFTSEPIGPFLIDMLTGRLNDGAEFRETFAIKTLNRNSNYTFGSSTSYVTANKNHLIIQRSVPVHAPMFWELAAGTMRLTPTRIVFKVGRGFSFDNTSLSGFQYSDGVVQYKSSVNLNKVSSGHLFRDGEGVEYQVQDVNSADNNITILSLMGVVPTIISENVSTHLDGSIRIITDNKFCAGIKCIPPLELDSDHTWRVNLLSNEDCSVRFIFAPNQAQEFTLASDISKQIGITLPAGEPITNMEINITSQSNMCEVRMNEWSPLKDTVEQIEYSFVVEAVGSGVYQASGLIIKPYFMGSEFLKTSYDINASYDSGKIYF